MSYPETRFDKWRVERFHKHLNRRISKAIARAEAWGLTLATVDIPERHHIKLRAISFQLMDEWAKAGYHVRVQEHYDHLGYCHIALFVW